MENFIVYTVSDERTEWKSDIQVMKSSTKNYS